MYIYIWKPLFIMIIYIHTYGSRRGRQQRLPMEAVADDLAGILIITINTNSIIGNNNNH